MKNTAALLIAFAACVLGSCRPDDGSRDIEAFYFPIKALVAGKVYEYRSVGNPNDPPVYWYYRSVKENGSFFLLGNSYDQDFTPDQSVREERVGNGMLLTDFYTFEPTENGKKQPVRANIAAANVFPFRVKEPAGVLLCSINWIPAAGGSQVTVVKNRQFDSDTVFTFQGRQVPSIQFNTRELLDQEEVGHLELEFGGTEVYAKGIGLIYFRKDITNGWRMEYQLADIHTLEAFEQKYKVALSAK